MPTGTTVERLNGTSTEPAIVYPASASDEALAELEQIEAERFAALSKLEAAKIAFDHDFRNAARALDFDALLALGEKRPNAYELNVRRFAHLHARLNTLKAKQTRARIEDAALESEARRVGRAAGYPEGIEAAKRAETRWQQSTPNRFDNEIANAERQIRESLDALQREAAR